MIDIVIAHKNTNQDRIDNLKYTVSHYKKYLPNSKIIISECDSETNLDDMRGLVGIHHKFKTHLPDYFSKSLIMNEGFRFTNAEYIIFADSDIIIEESFFENMADHIKELDNNVVIPYKHYVYDLSYDQTNQIINKTLNFSETNNIEKRITTSSGGIIFIKAEKYIEMGGFDPRFIGYGGEDDAFFYKANKMYGVLRPDYKVYHLYHERQSTVVNNTTMHYNNNVAMVREYENYNKEQLINLINSIGYDHIKRHNITKRKIGIVMTYYNRQYQLNKTLETINKQNYENLFVVVVDDNSDEDIVLPECNFQIEVIKIGKEKQWTNPEPAYNKGFLYLLKNYDAEIIISQNAECYHVGNVLEYANENTTINNYVTFSCYSLDQKNTFDPNFNIINFINILGNDRSNGGSKSNGWYNHPIHRPTAFEFCSAIHRENLIKLNGYDERLAFGIGYGDDHLLHRIKLLGLKIEITKSPIVAHQWHEASIKSNVEELSIKNKNLFQNLKQENNIMGIHLFTSNLC